MRREGEEVARQRIDGVDADVGAVIAAPAQRQKLRAEALGDAIARVPLQRRRVAGEGEALREGARQRASLRVLQRAFGDGDFVNLVRQEFRDHAQSPAVGFDGKIVDRRRDAQRLARAQNVDRLGRRIKGERELPLARRRIGDGGVAFFFAALGRRKIGCASQHAFGAVVAPAAAAARLRRREGRRSAQPQFIGLVVESGFVGKPQPQDGDAAVGDPFAEADDVGLLPARSPRSSARIS